MKPFPRFALLGGLYVAVWWNIFSPIGLRFTLPLLNYLFVLLVQVIPFRLIGIASANWRGLREAAAMLIAVPLALVAVPAALGTSACVVLGAGMVKSDPSFERLHDERVPGGRVVVYRTNGGATTDFGIVVRQECTVVPWLVVVERGLVSQYHAFDARLSVDSAGRAVIDVHGEVPRRVVAGLRSWPCVGLSNLTPPSD